MTLARSRSVFVIVLVLVAAMLAQTTAARAQTAWPIPTGTPYIPGGTQYPYPPTGTGAPPGPWYPSTTAEMEAWQNANVRENNLARKLARDNAANVRASNATRSTVTGITGRGVIIGKNSLNAGVVPGGAVRAAKGARLASGVARGLSGPVGWTMLGAEVVYVGYSELNPPPDWDWESGEDFELSEGSPVESSTVDLLISDAHTPFINTDGSGSNAVLAYSNGDSMSGPGSTAAGTLGFGFGDEQSGDNFSTWATRNGTDYNRELFVRAYTPDGTRCMNQQFDGTEWAQKGFFINLSSTNGVASFCGGTGISMVEIVGVDAPERTLLRAYPEGAVLGADRARLVASVDCIHPDGGGSVLTLTTETPWYDDHDDRPNLPSAMCASGYRIVDAWVYRELESGGRGYIIGGSMEDSDPDVSIEQQGRAPSPFILFNSPISPAPLDDLSPEARAIYEPGRQDGSADNPVRIVLRETVQDRPATPGQDSGWQFQPGREDRYGCFITDGTDTAELPLAECVDLQYETDPDTGQPTAPAPGVAVEDVPAEEPVPDPVGTPELDEPTDTGAPPTSPQAQVSCMAAAKEEGGFSSFIVFAGVACALQWAFVPSPGFTAEWSEVASGASGKPPFSLVTATADWVDGFTGAVGDPGEGDCLKLEAPVEGFGSYTFVDACGSHPVTDEMASYRPVLTVALYGLFLLPLAWWAWRQYAPGSQGAA